MFACKFCCAFRLILAYRAQTLKKQLKQLLSKRMGPIGPNQSKCTAKFARTDVITLLSTTKLGDNVFDIVRPSVCLLAWLQALSCLNSPRSVCVCQ